ncbi:MAG: hypothetical protein PHI59_06175, partial [Candidatus Omnitrophica bacterium]|nr:hypothetical protein [Candidatus Omnitrophota bacterium]
MQPKVNTVKDGTAVNTQGDDKSNSNTNTQAVIISGHAISAPAATVQIPNPTVNAESITTSADDSKTNYVPNEIIVKFKAEAASTLEQETTDNGKALSSSTVASLPTSLGNLTRKHRVKKIVPIFKNFKKDKQKLETLQLKNNNKSKYKLKSISISTKEEHILKRLKRAPKDAKIPDLDRIYKIELGKGQSVEEAVAEYSKDP